MFRTWLSGFWRDYKDKIMQAAKVFGILILIAISAGVVFSSLGKKEVIEDTSKKEVYNPSKTVISGSDISEQEFKEEDNLINKFVDFCNKNDFKSAYNLLTDDCKSNLYPNLDSFINKYCKYIFQSQKEYNMQSWINKGKFNTYRVRFIEDFLNTGDYENSEKLEDYITIVTDNDGNKGLNVNSYIGRSIENKTTNLDELEANVSNIDTYKDYVTIYMDLKNKTENEMQLDILRSNIGIKLACNDGKEYALDQTNLTQLSLNLKPNAKKQIKLTFKKQYGNNVTPAKINFKNVILNYTEYTENPQDYDNYKNIYINL